MIWLLLACNRREPYLPPDTSAEDTAAAADTDSSGAGDVSVEVPSPTWDADEAAAQISAVFARGVPEPVTAREVFIGLFDHRDDRCPGGQNIMLPGNFQGCTAESGWLYAGIAVYGGVEDVDALEDFSLLGDCYIISPDGDWFIGAGELDYAVTGDADIDWTGAISGQWSYPPQDGWMQDGSGSAVLDIHAQSRASGAWSVALDGGIYLGGTAIRVEGLSAESGACGGEPSGTVTLRDPSGYWYAMTADCGCGPISWADGSALGEACFSAADALGTLAEAGRP